MVVFRAGVAVEVLDVGNVRFRTAKAGGEGVPDLVDGEGRPASPSSGGSEGLVGAAA